MKVEFPIRTNSTNLSDNELLILDAVFFQPGTSARRLYRRTYAECMNTPYRHSLTNKEVLAVFKSFHKRGIAKIIDSQYDPKPWAATEYGLGLWEQERTPIWERYLEMVDYYVDDFDGTDEFGNSTVEPESGLMFPVLRVQSPNQARINEYLELALKWNDYVPRDESRVHLVHRDFLINDLKPIAEMHAVYLPIQAERRPIRFPDIEYIRRSEDIEERQTWWGDVPDLDRLHRKLAGLPRKTIRPSSIQGLRM